MTTTQICDTQSHMIYTYMQYFLDMDYYHTTIARLCRESKEQGITLSPDAQQFRQKIKDLGALDLTDENINKQIPQIYWQKAVYYNIHLFPADFDYINNKIRPNPIFNLTQIPSHSKATSLALLSNIVVFHEPILNDPDIPRGIESVIKAYIGETSDLPKRDPETKKVIKVKDALAMRRPYIELWFEMVGLTH